MIPGLINKQWLIITQITKRLSPLRTALINKVLGHKAVCDDTLYLVQSMEGEVRDAALLTADLCLLCFVLISFFTANEMQINLTLCKTMGRDDPRILFIFFCPKL